MCAGPQRSLAAGPESRQWGREEGAQRRSLTLEGRRDLLGSVSHPAWQADHGGEGAVLAHTERLWR